MSSSEYTPRQIAEGGAIVLVIALAFMSLGNTSAKPLPPELGKRICTEVINLDTLYDKTVSYVKSENNKHWFFYARWFDHAFCDIKPWNNEVYWQRLKGKIRRGPGYARYSYEIEGTTVKVHQRFTDEISETVTFSFPALRDDK